MGDVFFTRKYIKEKLTNFFGTGVDGNFSTGGNTNLNVLNTGSFTGDMVVRQYESLTINSGHTLTTNQPCRGLLIYVKGNCTINGTLSMTARGAFANPTVNGGSDGNTVDSNGLRFPFLTASGNSTLSASESLLNGCGTLARQTIANHPSINGDGSVLTIPRIGAVGAIRAFSSSNANGNIGGTGTNGQTGGGGSGGTRNGNSGPGAAGTCFSGGSGGGGNHYAGSSGFNSIVNCAGGAFGGAGGPGYNGTGTNEFGAGGAGNNGGNGGYSSGSFASFNNDTVSKGQNGTGGLIVLIVGGTLTISSSGAIRSNGSNGGTRSASAGAGGGASGGGSINIAYTQLNNSGTIQANGGAGGPQPNANWNPSNGGAGGTGSIQILQVL